MIIKCNKIQSWKYDRIVSWLVSTEHKEPGTSLSGSWFGQIVCNSVASVTMAHGLVKLYVTVLLVSQW